MRLGFRTRIELPSCITKDFKYLVVDATPPGMSDYINPIVDPYNDQLTLLAGTLLAGNQQQREQQREERNEKRQQKRKEVIAGLNTLIGQLTGLLEYYNTEEREKVEEDIDRFVKKNHLAFISTPWYQPSPFNFDNQNDLKRKHRDEEILKIAGNFKKHDSSLFAD
jgi:hypothetical protein